jgi:alkanesulfonate monooxygenase SsuD/methylene tetrahydromethanopterin reductase-like flavin-dependent oxidoreductase (luciferase family)
MGEKGIGVLSFSLATPFDDLIERVERYRKGLSHANPVGKFVNGKVAALALTNCAEREEDAHEAAGDASMWYMAGVAESAFGLVRWMDELKRDFETYEYRRTYMKRAQEGKGSRTFADLMRTGTAMIGTPDHLIETAKKYEAAGADLLLCLLQMKDIPQSKILKTIELMGEHVLPEFAS